MLCLLLVATAGGRMIVGATGSWKGSIVVWIVVIVVVIVVMVIPH